MIGAAAASVAGCFAYVAGWFSPHRLTQARLIDTFEEWRTGMNDIPVFAVRTAEAFNEQLLASKPDPA